MKKTLAFLLAFLLMFSVFGYNVSAADDADEEQGGYFVVGTMTDWKLDTRYQVKETYWYDHDGTLGGVVYNTSLYLASSDAFKIVYSPDGNTLDNAVWFPEGKDNAFNQESRIVEEEGYYRFTFSPDYKPNKSEAGTSWYYDCIGCIGYCYKEPLVPDTENITSGYYAVGTMTDWKLDNNYKIILDPFYKREVPLSMTDIFKIAYTPDGKTITEWYTEDDGKCFNEGKHIIWDQWPEQEITFSPEGGLYIHPTMVNSSYKDILEIDIVIEPENLKPIDISKEEPDVLLYKDSFDYQYRRYYDIVYYDELYYHRDENGEIDWVLIFATQGYGDPWIFYTEIANRIIIKDGWEYPFSTGFAVYDVKNNKFVDVNYGKYYNGQPFDPGEYPGFIRAFDEYGVWMNKSFYVNRLIGDIDLDDELTIIDATLIQRCDVRMRDWPQDDMIDPEGRYTEFDPLTYYSDFDHDGERDVVDATMLQRYVTRID